jgi:hypothetical protein
LEFVCAAGDCGEEETVNIHILDIGLSFITSFPVCDINNPPSSITTSASNTNFVPPTTLPSSPPSQGLSTGVRAGIGVGAAVIAILLSLTLFLALKLKKKKRQERQDATVIDQPHIESGWKLPDTANHDIVPPAELNRESALVELGTGSGGIDIQELADGRTENTRRKIIVCENSGLILVD